MDLLELLVLCEVFLTTVGKKGDESIAADINLTSDKLEVRNI